MFRFTACALAIGALAFYCPGSSVYGDGDSKSDSKADSKAEADSKPAAKDTSAEKKPDALKVGKGPFKVIVVLDGIFEARQTSEVAFRPNVWTELTVEKAAEHGDTVKAGDMLVQFDRTKINEQIRDLQLTTRVSELARAQMKADLDATEPLVPLDLASAERSKKNAASDLDNFEKRDRDLRVKQTDLTIQYSEMSLASMRDELEQLEKMYKADDLTEETEEIVVKRQRQQVDLAKASLALSKVQREKLMSVELPREEDSLKESVSRQSVALRKAQLTLPMSITKLRMEIDKNEYEQAKSTEKLDKLRRDAEAMEIKSPIDGIVYYGACERGRWTSSSDMARKLRRGGSAAPHEVLITVVPKGPLAVRATLPEKELHQVRCGVTGSLAPVGFPDRQVACSVQDISPTPDPAGNFSAAVVFAAESDAAAIVPGMHCKVRLNAYSADDALTAPIKSVFGDEEKGEENYVYVVDAGGKHARRTVRLGRRNTEKVEIIEGLADGDSILRKRPDDDQ